MSEMVEKVARAIFEQQNKVSIYPNRWESDPSHWRGMARAAIEAMREPTRDILNAAVDTTGAGSGMSWVNRSPQTLFEQAHRGMIDAALKD